MEPEEIEQGQMPDIKTIGERPQPAQRSPLPEALQTLWTHENCQHTQSIPCSKRHLTQPVLRCKWSSKELMPRQIHPGRSKEQAQQANGPETEAKTTAELN